MQSINCPTLFLVRKLNGAYTITLPLLAERMKVNSALSILRLPSSFPSLHSNPLPLREKEVGCFSLLHQRNSLDVKYLF